MSVVDDGPRNRRGHGAVVHDDDREPGEFRELARGGSLLTTRGDQSGEVDYDGHISRRGDKHVRALLYEAATVMLSRVRSDSVLRSWGLKLREKVGFKRAAVALARKLAVVMHAMWRDGRVFDPATGAPA